MAWHGYIHYSELAPGWSNGKREAAQGFYKGMGLQSGTNPAQISHWATSPDGKEIVTEALYQDAELTEDAIYDGLAAVLSLPRAAVEAVAEYEILGTESATWEESRVLAVAVVGGW